MIADSIPTAMMLCRDDRWLYINRAEEERERLIAEKRKAISEITHYLK